MENTEQIKAAVREKYSEIALQDKADNQASCCGAGGCSTEVYNIMTDDYSELAGYNPDADLGLGCGLAALSASQRASETPTRRRGHRRRPRSSPGELLRRDRIGHLERHLDLVLLLIYR